MKVDLSGKVAVVTGSGRAIGRAIAKSLVENGCKVVVATRTAATGQAVVDELNAIAPNHGALYAADLSTRKACEGAISAAIDKFGALDILVHNAGVFPFTLFDELTDEEFDGTLKTNLYAMMWMARAAFPHLEKSGQGRIVAISSVIGNHSYLAGMQSYATSKAALNGFCRNLAIEAAAKKITVNIVEPGLIVDREDPHMPAELESAITQYIPLGRSGMPTDIATAVLFYASPDAHWVTGQITIVDGGMGLADKSAVAMATRL
ncbi:MAG: SDR family NAD(P)-dependent oxidoreductase [Novosphingobium sp.]